MWTFHQERNHLYIRCTKLLWLIWANIRLLWATQCQALVKTIRFTYVVHMYKLILAFAHGKTSSACTHASLTPLPCSERLAAAWVVFTTSSLGTSLFTLTCCSCHVHVQYIYYCMYMSNCTCILIWVLFTCTILHFVHVLPPPINLNNGYQQSY